MEQYSGYVGLMYTRRRLRSALRVRDVVNRSIMARSATMQLQWFVWCVSCAGKWAL